MKVVITRKGNRYEEMVPEGSEQKMRLRMELKNMVEKGVIDTVTFEHDATIKSFDIASVRERMDFYSFVDAYVS